MLLQAGGDPDEMLLTAAKMDRDQIVDLLLRVGAQVNCQTSDQEAIIVAAKYGSSKCLKLLFAAGTVEHISDIVAERALILAVKNKHSDCLNLMLKAGVNLNAQYNGPFERRSCGRSLKIRGTVGQRAVMCAVYHGNTDCLNILIAAGVSVNARGEKGRTAIILANGRGKHQCL